jgi:hypothetical protein
MAWITITAAECKARLQKEWAAVANAAKATGEEAEDVVERVRADEVTRIRGRVPSSVKLGEAGTIPDEMKTAFFALWVFDFLTLLPGLSYLLDANRVTAYNNATSELRDLANGKINLVPPVDAAPAAEQPVKHAVEIAKPARVIQDMNTAGLL